MTRFCYVIDFCFESNINVCNYNYLTMTIGQQFSKINVQVVVFLPINNINSEIVHFQYYIYLFVCFIFRILSLLNCLQTEIKGIFFLFFSCNDYKI